MAKNDLDSLCPIGHNERSHVKSRCIEYFITPSGRMPAKEWLESMKDKVTQAILYKRIRQADISKSRTYWIKWLEDQSEK